MGYGSFSQFGAVIDLFELSVSVKGRGDFRLVNTDRKNNLFCLTTVISGIKQTPFSQLRGKTEYI